LSDFAQIWNVGVISVRRGRVRTEIHLP